MDILCDLQQARCDRYVVVEPEGRRPSPSSASPRAATSSRPTSPRRRTSAAAGSPYRRS